MKNSSILVALLLMLSNTGYAAEKKEKEDYKSYQSAYNLILDEKWTEAENGFEKFIEKFPESNWMDDAKFWQCYVLEKQNHLEKSAACYVTFIQEYKNSGWINDARANLIKLANKLSLAGNTQYDALVESLHRNNDEQVALTALYALRRTSKAEAIEAALNLLERSKNSNVRSQIINMLALADYTPKVANALKKVAMHDSDAGVKLRAISQLISKDPETAEEILSTQIFKEDKAFQTHGVSAISRLPDERSIPLLTKIIQTHPEFSTKLNAAQVLARKDGQKALSLLQEFTTNDVHVQRLTIEILIRLPDNKGIPQLIKLAKTHPHVQVRTEAITKLGTSKDPRARQALLDLVMPE